MASPVAFYGLTVPAGDVMVPAVVEIPASFRITMAAIDPSAAPEFFGTATDDAPPRATLKLIRQPFDMDEEEDSEFDSDEEDGLQALLDGGESDEESSSDDEDKNGGPSDPAKSKKARKEAAMQRLKDALAGANESEDDDMGVDGTNGVNGILSKLNKGKAKATGDEEDSDDEDSEDLDIEEFVICTLDPAKNYQQTLDITIGQDERVFFKVSGTHAIHLTGNYVVPADELQRPNYDDDDEEDEDYDLSPDEDELDLGEESDDLDALENPKFTEILSEDEEAVPELIKAGKESKKGKNKRAAADSDDEPVGLDEIMAKSLKPAQAPVNGDVKLSKKQLKKLKNNAGEAVAANADKKNGTKADLSSTTESPNNKKVQFAKNLEQGPTGSKADTKAQVTDSKKEKKDGDKNKATLGVKTIQGVKIDDKKLGTGRAAKKGDKVGMRYIGKLTDGKVFDSNKSGKPFSFKLGTGEVIKGWDIGIAGMAIGGERRITIPAPLAYGSKAMPGIPANSVLAFDVKLLEIN